MDYCSTCRRHLNGALVCPGCGAYAPDIAPRTGRLHQGDLLPGSAAPEPPAPADDVVDAPVAAEGRAARRRQVARWKKNKRRAAVATAVALVGGGLSVAAMNRGTADRAQASAAPDTRGMGGAEERTELTDPPATGTGTHRSERVVTSAPRSADAPHQRSTAASRTALKLVPSDRATAAARAEAAAPTATAQRPEQGQPSAVAEPSAPAEETADPSSPPVDTAPSDSATQEPAPETSESATPADPTPPAQLCLLVICLG
ncbi:hypothetical protein ABZ439_18385 [Streptomyces sp. NPDC005840]|uniref:SCO2400 family protein n=1 Tax=unclassified Streptomyces TaxID=2593676 RepID=UPI0033346152